MHYIVIMCILFVFIPVGATGSLGVGLIMGIAMLIGLFKIIGLWLNSDKKKGAEEAADAVQDDAISDDVIKEDAAAETMKPDAGVSTGSSLRSSHGSGYGSSYGSSYESSRPGYLYDIDDLDDPDLDEEDLDDDDDYDSYGSRHDNFYDDRESMEAGGLPRHLSPYSDISNPYDRAALEDFDFYGGYDSSSLFGDDD